MTDYRKFSQGFGEWEVSKAGQLRRIKDGFKPTQRSRSIHLGLSEKRKVCVIASKVVCEAWHTEKRIADCPHCGHAQKVGGGWRKGHAPRSPDLIKWAHERFTGKGTCQ